MLSLTSLFVVVLIIVIVKQSTHECIICNHRYPFFFVKMIDKYSVCLLDLNDFQNSNWVKISSIKMHPNNSQKAIKLYESRDKLKSQKIKSYVDHNYSEDGSTILSQMNIYVQLKDLEKARGLLVKEELK